MGVRVKERRMQMTVRHDPFHVEFEGQEDYGQYQ
jgi:hypothetical protein